MDSMERLYLSYRKYIIAFALVVILVLIYFNFSRNNEFQVEASIEDVLEEPKIEHNEEDVIVDIKGFVKNPGVYALKNGSRINDLINLAGGVLEEGNTEHINLSKKISDQMVIRIFSNKEIKELSKKEPEIIYIEKECVCEIIDPVCPITDIIDAINDPNNDENSKDNNEKKKISINNSSIEELTKIPGIGEVKAKDIIEYRTKEPFVKIEDIMNVKGIGKALFDKIKDYIDI